nr:(-)-4S-limonene synthase [Abies grandis]
MALLSIVSLQVPKSCGQKSLISSSNVQKALCISTAVPTLRMRRRQKALVINMKLTTVSHRDDNDGGVLQRRIADHHPNLWEDDFIQSLSSPYGGSSYSERAETLVEEVKEMFNSIPNNRELFGSQNDLLTRLWMVDSIERLGIDRHFQNEIRVALDYVYSYWKEKEGIGCGRDSTFPDLNSTALALRTLRLHGYNVSSDVLEYFKDQKGHFACPAILTEGQITRSVLNLYRASLVAFPGEKVMEEAEIFSASYLKEVLQKIPVSNLSGEIEYVLEYGWHTNLPRLEARNYIEVYEQSGYESLNEMPYMNMKKLLQLAKLEFNIFHSLQLRELQSISRWWKESGSSQLTFTRHRHVEYYTMASCISMEPKHSAFRMEFVKVCHLVTVLDDIYDTFGTMNELQLFTDAIKRWDLSTTRWLPEYMKGVYMDLYQCINEMVEEAQKTQGRDMLNYIQNGWEALFDTFIQEAKWISSSYLPTFEEYLKNAKVSSGSRIATLQPILTLDVPLPDYILQEIDYPSRFNELASSILRLRGDTRCYKADRARGEEASAISCYMKDHPGSTEEDALNHINAMISDAIRELNWELLRPDSKSPISSKKHAFDITRAFHHVYKYRDGYTVSNNETKNLVMKTVLEPLAL